MNGGWKTRYRYLEACLLVGSEHKTDFWRSGEGRDPILCRPPEIVAELQTLAEGVQDAAELSAVLYEMLRKHMGKTLGREILLGIQYLAQGGDPAGARLLGAMLEVAAPAERLLPLVRNLSSSRRLWLGRLKDDSHLGCIQEDWLRKSQDLALTCCELLKKEKVTETIPQNRVGWEEPWGAMRTVVAALVRHALSGGTLAPDSRCTLVELLHLEIDAWQERISILAGSIDPFKVAAITRVLPILSRADADIRDLRHLVQLIAAGQDADAFTKPRLRALEVLEERDLVTLDKVLCSSQDLEPLARVFKAQQENPLPVPVLSHGVARVLALDNLLAREGLRPECLDLVQACLLLISGHGQGEFAMAIPPDLAAAVDAALTVAHGPRPPGTGPECWSLGGVEILVGQLVVILPESDSSLVPWPHFLPTDGDADPVYSEITVEPVTSRDEAAEVAEVKQDENLNTGTLKNLVLSNIQSTSLVLGFLRNPKFISIPGLVEAVATRSRNPRVIEVVAADRTLHTGFANRGVPLACLRSPVNVSVKILRKFIHVKFISKMDLKRLAKDRAGIRKEVIREIEKYLAALA